MISKILLLLSLTPLAVIAHGAEQVTVTMKDGKKEKGELLKYDRNNLELRYHVGENHLDVKIPWSDVKEVSNGLTFGAVQKKWMEENKDKLCETCQGTGNSACPKCNGTGLLPKPMTPCPQCKGEGTIHCKAKGCDKGKVDCPGHCLKLSEGEWTKHDDGLRWRKFTYPGGWQEWSERHLGEAIEIKDGKPVNIGKCPMCSGTTKVDCTECKGAGSIACTTCKGKKEIPQAGPDTKCDSCKAGKIECPACKGAGTKQTLSK